MRWALAVVLAIGANASAVVVYFNPPTGVMWRDPAFGGPFYSDLNGDGNTDFGFFLVLNNDPNYMEHSYSWSATNASGFSSGPLSVGSTIGPTTTLTGTGMSLGGSSYNRNPEPPYNWSGGASMSLPEGDSYWGLRFHDAAGTDHFGWLRFRGHADNTPPPPNGFVNISVVDYAFETQAGVPITVGAIPAPGSLVTIGGLNVLLARRRRACVRDGRMS
jgi:hypothetical protein